MTATPEIPAFETLNLSLTTSKKYGTTYVRAHRNQWIKEKGQPRQSYKEYVGTLDKNTGRVKFSKKFLQRRPEFEGRILYYEANKLVERSDSEVIEETAQRVDTEFCNVLTLGSTFACWQTALEHNILADLKTVLGKNAEDFLRLAIYQYLDSSSMDSYKEWQEGSWLPDAKLIDGRRISEILSNISAQTIIDYCKLRFQRCQSAYEKMENLAESEGGFKRRKRYLALDSTGISTYSCTIENSSWGNAKQNPELKQINFCIGIDYVTGELCYAHIFEGSINDKAIYRTIMHEMVANGFNLEHIVLVTDRGFMSLGNLQSLINAEIDYVCGVPLSEKALKDRFLKHRESFFAPQFRHCELGVAARTFEENFNQQTETGQVPVKSWLHLYRDHEKGEREASEYMRSLGETIKKKNNGETIDSKDWNPYAKFIKQNKDKVWEINYTGLQEKLFLFGCFAIRSNCIADPFECLRVYRERNNAEVAFRQVKVLNEGDRLNATETTYRGKLMLHIIAQSLRSIHSMTARKTQSETKLKIPGDSMDKLMKILNNVKAVRYPGRAGWSCPRPPKKALDCLELLGIKKPLPQYLKMT